MMSTSTKSCIFGNDLQHSCETFVHDRLKTDYIGRISNIYMYIVSSDRKLHDIMPVECDGFRCAVPKFQFCD